LKISDFDSGHRCSSCRQTDFASAIPRAVYIKKSDAGAILSSAPSPVQAYPSGPAECALIFLRPQITLARL
jgi:hypothetical protein